MPLPLPELQRQFASSVYDETPDVLAQVRDGIFPAARHLAVYRNNTFANLTEALAAIYPVTQRLVGHDFFEHMAAHFIPSHPPRSGNLHDFGAALSDFLETFGPASEFVYLPEVARLEWVWHRAFHAADADALALASLANVPPESYDALKFKLHPSAHLLRSAFPLFKIWQTNQPEFVGDATVSLDSGIDYLLVIRRGLRTQIETLGAGEYALLRALAHEEPISSANTAALRVELGFDLTETLQRHIASDTLVAFHI